MRDVFQILVKYFQILIIKAKQIASWKKLCNFTAMKKLVSFISFLLCVYCAFGSTGRHWFNNYSIENGLPHNSVSAILQDETGFIWMGTRNGLSRFDGTSFMSVSLPAVNALAQTKDGALWIGTEDGFFSWNRVKGCAELVIEGSVRKLKIDKDGQLWILSGNHGLYQFDTGSGKRTCHLKDQASEGGPERLDILPDRSGVIWISCSDGSIERFDARRARSSLFNNICNGQAATCLLEEDEDTILLGLSDGSVYRLDKRSGKSECYVSGSRKGVPVHSMIRLRDGELWIGTESGLFISNPNATILEQYVSDIDTPSTLPDNAILCIIEDNEGGIWLGTSRGGAAYTNTEQNFITIFFPSARKKAFHGKTVRDFVETADGTIWIGTEDSGLFQFDPGERTFTEITYVEQKMPYRNISALFADADRLYVGLSQQGFCVYNPRSGQIRHWSNSDDGFPIVLSIFKDSQGTCWLGTQNGLWVFDAGASPAFQPVEGSPVRMPVMDIIEDRSHNLWFATNGSGLYSFDLEHGSWKNHPLDSDGSVSERNRLLSIMEDNRDFLWIGTEGGGAFRFDPVSEKVTSYGKKTGLGSDIVFEVLEDKLGNLWFSTGMGLTRLSAETGNSITYTYNYGAPSNLFNYKSALKASDGKLYFGTVRGFVEVSPEDIRTNSASPKVVFTGYTSTGEDHYLEPEPEQPTELIFRYDVTNVSIHYAALSYSAPQNIRYSYKLLGLDKDWIECRSNTIQYTRIPPGSYTLYVRSANGDGAWYDPPATLHIKVTPPFWVSPSGVTLEVLLVLGILFGLFLRARKRIMKNNLQKIQRIQETERSVAQKTKIDFFASIIHEIRTPLSLIKAPFERVKMPNLNESERTEDIKIIETNIDRLLQLSNEILDFSRIEEKAFTVRPKRTDVKSIVEEVIRSFSFYIRENQYTISKVIPDLPVIAWLDPEILIKIVSNLFGNAVKFAESEINLRLEDTSDLIRITISNDGPVISPDDRDKVFLAFYRENRDDLTSGTGLGLPLVKRLSELHGGRVYIDPDEDKKTTIVVELPKGKEPEDNPQVDIQQSEVFSPSSETEEDGRKTIAIIDDDSGIRNFLNRALSRSYKVISCKGVADLYSVLEKQLVDMVITDIMMPGTDGITLCNDLKTSFDYGHIPVILLSARTDRETRIEGLGAECDAFIEKPFSLEYLESQIENIFSRQHHMRDYYARYPHLKGGGGAMRLADQEFLDKISLIITEHMDEDDFKVDKIADILNMSRSSLYRKIRGITSMSPNELLQTVRLKKAAELISNGGYRVSEVGYLVGFSSVAYFSTCFRKQFGVTPSEFKKKMSSSGGLANKI